MKTTFNKLILAVLVAALVLAAIPATGAFAQGENPPKGGITNERLEQIWTRMSDMYERLGKLFDGSVSDRLDKLQERIDKAKANGKDVATMQTALDNFRAALKKARPIYESMKGIFNSHQGFDASGKVTDAGKAKATLKELRDKFKELKDAMGGTGRAFRDALQTFRDANRPADGSA